MRYLCLLFSFAILSSCWKTRDKYPSVSSNGPKVWGSKPVYAQIETAKQIYYSSGKQAIRQPGNIYAFGKLIFQVDVGRGIHVINNIDPSKADRVGFITVNGCQQISIKGNYMYTNSYSDLVTINIADTANLREVGRVKSAFPEFVYNYPLARPEEPGYYTCPRYDSVVVGWVKDSVYQSCYKN